jgi:hypothetical protein
VNTRSPSPLAVIFALVWIVTATNGIHGQTTSSGASFQNQFPDPLQYTPEAPDPPELQLTVLAEIALTGPLMSAPRWVGDHVEVTTAEGLVRVAWRDPARPVTVEPLPGSASAAASTWGLSPDGSHRARQLESRLIVQRSCSGCRGGWRRHWRLRVPGLAPARPLMTENRVYFGSADNRVFGVRRRNGHRLWATALDGRVLRELALWVATTEADVAAILAVPEPGGEMVALDVFSGSPLLRYRLSGEGDTLVGAPLSTADGHVLLARQGYSGEDATLIVLKLEAKEANPAIGDESAPKGYNPPTSNEAVPGEPAADQRADPPAPGTPKMR